MQRIFLWVLIFSGYSGKLFAQDQIIGKWLSPEKDVIVESFSAKGKYFGKIVWLKNPKNSKGVLRKDQFNPVPKKRKNKLIGLVVLQNLVYSNNVWSNGEVYNPNNGESYTCKIWMKNKNTILARGYWGMIYKTQEWTRVP